MQLLGDAPDGRERHPGAFRYIQQAVTSVREIQDPKPSKVFVFDMAAPGHSIQSASPERGLAVRVRTHVGAVVFQYVYYIPTDVKGARQRLRCYQLQVVCRRVILAEFSPDASHQAPDGQIKTR